jgi:hypothetical protein
MFVALSMQNMAEIANAALSHPSSALKKSSVLTSQFNFHTSGICYIKRKEMAG